MSGSHSNAQRVKVDIDRRGFVYRGRFDGARRFIHPTGRVRVPRHDAQLVNVPPVGPALDAGERELFRHRYERVKYTAHQGAKRSDHACYLFHLIVALEWTPSAHELSLLRNAFDECADLLFDLTDGYMTIGRAIVGGVELMGCADIQIFASNRLHPRAWVNGLHDPKKYQPIRLGRGLWSKRDSRLYPWHKHDGPAVLVHEWAHYALGLKDQYMRPVVINGTTLILPERNPVANTLMASLLSNELLSTVPAGHERTEWDALKVNPEFQPLAIPAGYVPSELPPEEVPQPEFLVVGSARAVPAPLWMQWAKAGNLPELLDEDHCWIYVLKGSLASPAQLIAQGVFADQPDGFPLPGAAVGDTVIAVGYQQRPDGTRAEEVAYTTIQGRDPGHNGLAVFAPWQAATPQTTPIIAVGGTIQGHSPAGRPIYAVSVDIHGPGAWSKHLFSFDQPQAATPGAPYIVAALDGHVLLTVRRQAGWELAVATFSIGGSPPAGFPGHLNPIPAGSSDGNAMIFFSDPAAGPLDNAQYAADQPVSPYQERYENLRLVVTTNLHAAAAPPADPQRGPRSYTFAVASNQSFALDSLQMARLNPTLVLYVDPLTLTNLPASGGGAPAELRLQICRLDQGAWRPLAQTHYRPQDYLLAIPLDADTAAELYAAPPRPAYYRVFLMENT